MLHRSLICRSLVQLSLEQRMYTLSQQQILTSRFNSRFTFGSFLFTKDCYFSQLNYVLMSYYALRSIDLVGTDELGVASFLFFSFYLVHIFHYHGHRYLLNLFSCPNSVPNVMSVCCGRNTYVGCSGYFSLYHVNLIRNHKPLMGSMGMVVVPLRPDLCIATVALQQQEQHCLTKFMVPVQSIVQCTFFNLN